MRLQEIMSTDVKTIPPTMPADEAWERMKQHRFHHLVVEERGKVVGVVSERDLGGARGTGLRRNRAVSDLMTPEAVTAKPTTTIREAANLLRGRSIGCLPVMEGRKLVGIITTTDMLELIGRGGPMGTGHNTVKQSRRAERHPRVSARTVRMRRSAR